MEWAMHRRYGPSNKKDDQHPFNTLTHFSVANTYNPQLFQDLPKSCSIGDFEKATVIFKG